MCGQEILAETEPAALDLTLNRSKIKHAVVCGHSDCKVRLLIFLIISSHHAQIVLNWLHEEPTKGNFLLSYIVDNANKSFCHEAFHFPCLFWLYFCFCFCLADHINQFFF